jgi:hypothetical protein
MNVHDYDSLVSEIRQVESILADIPIENALERFAMQNRLDDARAALPQVVPEYAAQKIKLTFRGEPVFGSHGIIADFATKAAGYFTEAYAAISASLTDSLKHMGPIPNRDNDRLLITGTALGSFGFEFEIPNTDNPPLNNSVVSVGTAPKTMDRILDLLQSSAEASDDALTEIVDEIHPRAVKKMAEFLDYVTRKNAWCALDAWNRSFRFDGYDQIERASKRLQDDNINQKIDSFYGEFQGVLPETRTFEFKLLDNAGIVKGKVGLIIADADILNREYLHQPLTIKLHAVQVGKSRPRYHLDTLEDITR